MKFCRSLLLGTSALAVNAVLTAAVILKPEPALACTDVSGSDATFSSPVNCVTWGSNNITITNTGSVTGTGITNSGNVVGSLFNSGNITDVNNSGVIGTTLGIFNDVGASIGTITNTGTISGSNQYGISNSGIIAAIINSTGALISSNSNGIFNDSTGSIHAITNNGVIIGTNSNGISNNHGIIDTITNNNGGTISGGYNAVYNFGGTIGVITNNSGGSIGGGFGSGIYNASTSDAFTASIGTLTNSGIISGNDGIYTSGALGTIDNSIGGTITGSSDGIANIVSGSVGSGFFIDSIMNSGVIIGSSTGIYNAQTIGSIANNSGGIISGGFSGIYNQNSGTIGAITNNGSISGGNTAISNSGTIGTLTNSGKILGTTNYGIADIFGTIGTIKNTIGGTISGGVYGILNSYTSSISTISNSGLITGVTTGINNTGSFVGNTTASPLPSSIGIITNNGTIFGGAEAISNNNQGTIGSIINSGHISGPIAIFSDSTSTILSAITNTGVISSNINIAQDITFAGGSSITTGTLTGYLSTPGTITANNVTFDSSAYQVLDDDVVVSSGSGTVTNDGTIRLNTTHTITGNYAQSSSTGLFVVGVTDSSHYGNIFVTGNAAMANDQIFLTGSLSVGDKFTIVQDHGTANYSGITATAAGFTGVVSSITSGGYNDLIVCLSQSGVACSNSGGGGGGNTPIVPGPALITPLVVVSNVLTQQTINIVGQHEDTLLAPNSNDPNCTENQSGIFWSQVSGGLADRASTANYGGFSQSFYGFTFGADDHISKNLTAGLALAWQQGWIAGSGNLNGTSLTINNVAVTSYAVKRFGPAYVDGMLNFGLNLYDLSRDAGVDEQAHANYQGTQYGGQIEAGYNFFKRNTASELLSLTPFVGFQALHTQINGYTENNVPASVAYSVGEEGINTFATTLGGKVGTSYATTWGDLMPEIKLGWVNDLTNSAITTPVTVSGQNLITTTPRVAQDGAQITLGLTLNKPCDEFSVRAEYDGDVRSDYASHAGLIRFDWKF